MKKCGLAARADTTLRQEESSVEEKERPGRQSAAAGEEAGRLTRESDRRAMAPPDDGKRDRGGEGGLVKLVIAGEDGDAPDCAPAVATSRRFSDCPQVSLGSSLSEEDAEEDASAAKGLLLLEE